MNLDKSIVTMCSECGTKHTYGEYCPTCKDKDMITDKEFLITVANDFILPNGAEDRLRQLIEIMPDDLDGIMNAHERNMEIIQANQASIKEYEDRLDERRMVINSKNLQIDSLRYDKDSIELLQDLNMEKAKEILELNNSLDRLEDANIDKSNNLLSFQAEILKKTTKIIELNTEINLLSDEINDHKITISTLSSVIKGRDCQIIKLKKENEDLFAACEAASNEINEYKMKEYIDEHIEEPVNCDTSAGSFTLTLPAAPVTVDDITKMLGKKVINSAVEAMRARNTNPLDEEERPFIFEEEYKYKFDLLMSNASELFEFHLLVEQAMKV